MIKQIFKILLVSAGVFLSACQSHNEHALKVGTIAGPESDLMETAKQVAKEQGLDIEIVEFTDYLQPNAALNDGSIDANMIQHQPYLDQQIKDKHYPLVAIGKTFVFPVGVYSNKIKNIQDIQTGGLVAIPNDPSNEGRALLLLEKANLIQLNKKAGLYATPRDITHNPKNLKFKELDASQIPRSLPDVDLAVINTNYAIPAGLTPTKDAIFLEDKHSPYANIIVIRKDRMDDPRMKQLVDAIQSEAVLEEARKLFKDQAIQAW